jgi:apolipoprotein N-acyltransferase
MDSNPEKPPRFWMGIAAITGSALLLYYGTGLHPLWPLTWFAILPILLYAGAAQRGPAVRAGFLAWAAGAANLWSYFVSVIGIPLGVVVAASAISPLLFAAVLMVWREHFRRGHWLRSILVFPSVWSALAYVSTHLSPNGTFGSIAYSQMNALPMIQVAAIAGSYGVIALLMIFPSALAVAFCRRAGRRTRLWAGLTAGLLVVLVFVGGELRISRGGAQAEGTVRLALIASDEPGKLFVRRAPEALEWLRTYARQARDAGLGRADVILLPEKVAAVSPSILREVDTDFMEAAHATQADILVGLDLETTGARFNQARLYSPEGNPQEYDKRHFVPGIETGYRAGTSLLTLRRPAGVWGVAVCKDMDFIDPSRDYGRAGVGLMLVPAWDFRVDDWLHSRMAVMRGVEYGFTLARTARQGALTVSDPYGRIIVEQSSAQSHFSTLIVPIEVRRTSTVYARIGDWFAVIASGLALILIAGALRNFRRETSSKIA